MGLYGETNELRDSKQVFLFHLLKNDFFVQELCCMNITMLNKVFNKPISVMLKELGADKNIYNLSHRFNELFIVLTLLPYVMEGRN